MAHIPITPEYLESVAKLGDQFAQHIRKWKATAEKAQRVDKNETMTGIKQVEGAAKRLLKLAMKYNGNFDALELTIKELADADKAAAAKKKKGG